MRKCTEADRETIFAYIAAEPEMNLFIYGDIENYGVDSDHVSVYVEEGVDSYDSLILKYFDFYILYSQRENYSLEPLIHFSKISSELIA